MYKGKKILALITARGGSKGIPGKNIIDLGGKPLIAWTIDAALKSKYIDRLILSSDDINIINVAKQFGCEVPFIRPAELATDTSTSMDAIMHALDNVNETYDYLMLLQPTSPFRTTKHIDDCISETIDQGRQLSVSVVKVHKHPDYMFYKGEDDLLKPVISLVANKRRQDQIPVYEHNGALYFSEIDFLKKVATYNTEEAYGFEMTGYANLDIDEISDLQYANYLIEKNLV